jgi:hypothetical protein
MHDWGCRLMFVLNSKLKNILESKKNTVKAINTLNLWNLSIPKTLVIFDQKLFI